MTRRAGSVRAGPIPSGTVTASEPAVPPALLTDPRLVPWPDPAWTPRAVVFDCDGLLVDTEAEWIATQDHYLARHDAVMDPATRRRITGRSAEVVVTAIAETVDQNPLHVAEELVALHRADIGRELRLLPGALDTVRAIAAKVPVAVASNSPREMLDLKLAGMGITEVLDASVAIEDVAEPKPAPDMYARGAELLGAAPADALAFEDSETGAEAATAAGLALIAVPSLPGQEPRAAVTLTSLEDPALHAWISTWEARR